MIAALAGLLASLWTGCGAERQVVIGTPEAATTSGYIEVDGDDAGDWTSVFMHHLLPAERMGQDLGHYVLWFVPKGGPPQRVGAMVYEPEHRKAKLKGRRPSGPFSILITAERTARPARPGGPVVAEHLIRAD